MARTIKTAAVAMSCGFINGLFGAGGGTILVPATQRFLGFETHKSHATAIAVIMPLSLLSAVIYLSGVAVDWSAIAYVSAGGVVGGYIGARLLNKLSSNKLNKLFGAFMIAAAIRMVL